MAYFDQIDDFLDGLLSAEGQQAFELALSADPALQRALAEEEATRAAIGMLQIDAAVERYEKVAVQYKAAKRRQRYRRGFMVAMAVVSLTTIGLGIYFLGSRPSPDHSLKAEVLLQSLCEEDRASIFSPTRTSAGTEVLLSQWEEIVLDLCDKVQQKEQISMLIDNMKTSMEEDKSLELFLPVYIGLLYLHEEQLELAKVYFQQTLARKGLHHDQVREILEQLPK